MKQTAGLVGKNARALGIYAAKKVAIGLADYPPCPAEPAIELEAAGVWLSWVI